MNVAFPFGIDSAGRVASPSSYDEHIRQLIEQLLFTSPAERVNRPDLGCGVLQLVFEDESDHLVVTTRMTIQAALDKYLGDRIQVESLDVNAEESQLTVTVQYYVIDLGDRRTAVFQRL